MATETAFEYEYRGYTVIVVDSVSKPGAFTSRAFSKTGQNAAVCNAKASVGKACIAAEHAIDARIKMLCENRLARAKQELRQKGLAK